MKYQTWVLILVFFFLGIGTKYGLSDDFDWPRWRGPNGDGISMETDWNPEALAGAPKVLWKVKLGWGCSNVSIQDNNLYTMGYKDRENVVYCLNAETGKEVWRYSYKSSMSANGPQPTPVVEDKYVYAMSSEGVIICLKVRNGKRRWVKDLVNEYGAVKPYYSFAGSPVIEGDLLILTANTYGMALNKNTGEMVWGSDIPPEKVGGAWCTGPHYTTPVLYEYEGKQSVIITSYIGVHSVEVESGKVQWLYKWEPIRNIHVSDPLVFDNNVFIAQYKMRGSVLLDIGGEEPKVKWQNLNMSSDNSSPIMIDGYIYGVDGGIEVKDCIFQCLDSKTGELVWEEKMDTSSVTFMAANGKLIILEEDSILRISEATPSSYQEISSGDILGGKRKYEKFWTLPVLYKGKIYCRDWSGLLVCVDVGK